MAAIGCIVKLAVAVASARLLGVRLGCSLFLLSNIFVFAMAMNKAAEINVGESDQGLAQVLKATGVHQPVQDYLCQTCGLATITDFLGYFPKVLSRLRSRRSSSPSSGPARLWPLSSSVFMWLALARHTSWPWRSPSVSHRRPRSPRRRTTRTWRGRLTPRRSWSWHAGGRSCTPSTL